MELPQVHVDAGRADLRRCILTIADQASQRDGTWDINGTLAKDLGSQTGTFGVFVTETDDHMQINTIYTNGDASLVAQNGDLRDARGPGQIGVNTSGGAANVEANNIDLAAYCRSANDATKCGNVGARAPPLASTDDLGNDLKIDSGHGDTQNSSDVIVGRVGIETTNDVFLTETGRRAQRPDRAVAQRQHPSERPRAQRRRRRPQPHPPVRCPTRSRRPTTATRSSSTTPASSTPSATIGVGSAVTNTASINAAGWILLRVGDNMTLGGLRYSPDFTGDVTFTQSATGDLISSSSPAWAAAAFAIGQAITVSGAPGSNGTYHIIALVDQNTVRVAEANVVANGTVRNVTVSTQTYPDFPLHPLAANALTDAQRISQNTKVVAGAWIDIHGDYDIYSAPIPNGGGQRRHRLRHDHAPARHDHAGPAELDLLDEARAGPRLQHHADLRQHRHRHDRLRPDVPRRQDARLRLRRADVPRRPRRLHAASIGAGRRRRGLLLRQPAPDEFRPGTRRSSAATSSPATR